MIVDYYNLFCSECKSSCFQLIKAQDVKVTLDLKKDEYDFKATCPECGHEIYNARRSKDV